MASEDPSAHQAVSLNGVRFAHADIQEVVRTFYGRVEKDPVLEIPFRSVHDWPEHIARLTHFWWIRFGGEPYRLDDEYDPVGKHYLAGFNPERLARWLELFGQTLSERLKPEQARLWALISERMGQSLQFRNEQLIQHRHPQGIR